MHDTEEIYKLLRAAQEQRAAKAKERGAAGKCPRPLELGELVMVRRPPPNVRDEDGEQAKVSVSRKLQPKAR